MAVVGAGAAGLAAAIFTARRRPKLTIVALDGARKIGAKILISGGGRCNVTNAVVTAADFQGGSPNAVRRVLNSFTVEQTVAFFREIGVELHEEPPDRKLFPNTNSAKTVLAALLAEAERCGVQIRSGYRVTGVSVAPGGFEIVRERAAGRDSRERACETGFSHERACETGFSPERDSRERACETGFSHELRGFSHELRGFSHERAESSHELAGLAHEHTTIKARRVVIATGGRSLPKTGSDGGGYELVQRLGHMIVPTVPALAPLVLDGEFHAPLSGVTHDVAITLKVEGQRPTRWPGSMVWTHFGISGPAAMNASGAWHRARLEERPITVSCSFLPGDDFAGAERKLLDIAASHPRSALHNALERLIPARLGIAVLAKLGIDGQTVMAQLSREHRRRLIHALLEWPMPVRDSRGYAYAEVTSGGVPLDEINPATMESRTCPGLYLVGEILDVDGRIGGFNFQWAWSSAWVAASSMTQET